MKRIFLYVIFLSLFSEIAIGQKNITIHGKIENGDGKTIELYNYSDKISQSEILLDKAVVGGNQEFTLRCFARYPMLVFLQIENYTQSFYVEPGRDYDIYVGNFDWNVDETQNIFLAPVVLPIEFIGLPKDDINVQIDNLNKVVNNYVANHQVFFDQRFHPQRRYFDSLMVEVENKCPDTENDFYNRYKKYYLAELKLNMKFDSRKNIFNEFIRNQPVLSYDENYMSLFTALYANAISRGTKDISVYRLAHWVYNLDYETFMDSIGMDPMLRHEQIRELAALIALKEAYHNFRYYDSKMVVKMIERIAQRTKFPEHKTIAANIIEGFENAEAGCSIQSFILPDVDKNMISLDDFRGKWIYISFVRVNDPNSLAEIETMSHFKNSTYENYDNVIFITIDCDREFQKMYHFLKNSKHGDRYNWTWLHFNNEFDLLNNFHICSYPSFILINPEGKLHYDITPAPSSGLLVSPPWKSSVNDEPSKSFFLNE